MIMKQNLSSTFTTSCTRDEGNNRLLMNLRSARYGRQSSRVKIKKHQIVYSEVQDKKINTKGYLKSKRSGVKIELDPRIGPAAQSQGSHSYMHAFGANTCSGVRKKRNEDKLTVLVQVEKPDGFRGNWPETHFFGIYDGHGGEECSEFLKENLHTFILEDENFPSKPKQAIINGFERAEKEFLSKFTHIGNLKSNNSEKKLKLRRCATDSEETLTRSSGSCAVIALVVDDTLFVANVGDSRAVLSYSSSGIKQLTVDHKPENKYEKERIKSNGGRVYRSKSKLRNSEKSLRNKQNALNLSSERTVGPYRIFPGRLSVSRSIGDYSAKCAETGGNSKVLIATPDIQKVKIGYKLNYLILGSDGMFENTCNQEIIEHVWGLTAQIRNKNIHEVAGTLSSSLIDSSMKKGSRDNISSILIAFKDFTQMSGAQMATRNLKLVVKEPKSNKLKLRLAADKVKSRFETTKHSKKHSVDLEDPPLVTETKSTKFINHLKKSRSKPRPFKTKQSSKQPSEVLSDRHNIFQQYTATSLMKSPYT